MTDIVTPPDVGTLPTPPVRGQAGFSAAVGEFLEALPQWGDDVEAAGDATYQNALVAFEAAADLNAAADVAVAATSMLAKSTSTLTVGTGTKTIHFTSPATGFAVNDQVVIVLRSDPSVRMFGTVATFDGSDDMTVTVVSGGVFGSGSYSSWLVISAAFLTTGATAADVWARVATDAAGVTPKSLADADAPQTAAYASTLTLDLEDGWNWRVTDVSASFTMGAPTGCRPGQVIVVDLLNTNSGIVLAVNAAWDRAGGLLGVLDPANGARNKFVGMIDTVDGSGVMTRGTYNVIRGLA